MTAKWSDRYSKDVTSVFDVSFDGAPDPHFNLRSYFKRARSVRHVTLRNVLAPENLANVLVSDLLEFHLANYPIKRHEFDTLTSIARSSPHLVFLRFENVPLGYNGFRAMYPYLENLVSLRLARCNLGATNVFRLIGKLFNLRVLEVVPTPDSFFKETFPNLTELIVDTGNEQALQEFLDRHPLITHLTVSGVTWTREFRLPPKLAFLYMVNTKLTDAAAFQNLDVDALWYPPVDLSSPVQLSTLLAQSRRVKTLGLTTYTSTNAQFVDPFRLLMKWTHLDQVFWTPTTFLTVDTDQKMRYVSMYHPTCKPFWSKSKSPDPQRVLAIYSRLNQDLCMVIASYLYSL